MRPWPTSQVRISILNVYSSPTDTELTEMPKGVIPELGQLTPKRKRKADRDPYLDLDADLDVDSDADVVTMAASKKVDKGKAKAINLPNSPNEDPAPKVCYHFIAQ